MPRFWDSSHHTTGLFLSELDYVFLKKGNQVLFLKKIIVPNSTTNGTNSINKHKFI